MKREYCVYKHECPNGKVYIGITGQAPEARWNFGHGYDSQLFGKAVRKYGWENIKHEILCSGLSLVEAYEEEQRYIAVYKATDKHYGYNCDAGGSGSLGHTVSEETRNAMRERTKKLWENEDIRNRLLAHLKVLNSSRIGTKMPRDVVRKSAISRGKKVSQYTLDGEYITTYLTMSDAARAIGKTQNTLIVRCCKNPGKYTAYGYIWRYASDHISDKEAAI